MNTPEKKLKRGLPASLLLLLLAIFVVAVLLFSYKDLLSPSLSTLSVRDTPLRYSTSLTDLGAPEGQWLSGFPSYSSFSVPLARDAKFRKATLNFRATVDVSEKAVASLRIAINDVRTHEQVLRPGRNKIRLQLPVEPDQKDESEIRVSMSLDGEIGDMICHEDDENGAVVHILPETNIKVHLAEPIYSVRDVMALLPRDVTIALPTKPNNRHWVSFASDLGVRLSHLGYEVSFAPLGDIESMLERLDGNGLIVLGDLTSLEEKAFVSHDEYDEVAVPPIIVGDVADQRLLGITSPTPDAIAKLLTTPLERVASLATNNPIQLTTADLLGKTVQLDELNVDTSVQQIKFKKNWWINYSLADMPDGKIPNKLKLAFQLPAGPSEFIHMVHVELNNQLVGSYRVKAPGRADLLLALPREHHQLRNRLSVNLQRYRDLGGCQVADARYPIQLLPDSALLFSDARSVVEGFADMPKQFRRGLQVRMPLKFTGDEAPAALNVLLPVLAEFLPFDDRADFLWVKEDSEAAPTKPYIAFQHVPPSTATKLKLEETQLIVTQQSTVPQAIELVDKVISVEHVISRYKSSKSNRNVAVHGLVVLHSENTPKKVQAKFAWQDTVILPDRDMPIEVLSNGSIPHISATRLDKHSDYKIEAR